MTDPATPTMQLDNLTSEPPVPVRTRGDTGAGPHLQPHDHRWLANRQHQQYPSAVYGYRGPDLIATKNLECLHHWHCRSCCCTMVYDNAYRPERWNYIATLPPDEPGVTYSHGFDSIYGIDDAHLESKVAENPPGKTRSQQSGPVLHGMTTAGRLLSAATLLANRKGRDHGACRVSTAGVPERYDYSYDSAQNLLTRTEGVAGKGERNEFSFDGADLPPQPSLSAWRPTTSPGTEADNLTNEGRRPQPADSTTSDTACTTVVTAASKRRTTTYDAFNRLNHSSAGPGSWTPTSTVNVARLAAHRASTRTANCTKSEPSGLAARRGGFPPHRRQR